MRGVGVTFGKACDPDAESMTMPLSKRSNMRDEVGREIEVAGRHLGTLRGWISA